MKSLSNYFQKIAYKSLSAVETDPMQSHQHEFNGIANLQEIFGSNKVEVEVVQMYLDDSDEPDVSKSKLTWYDARANHPSRTEYRLYYKDSPVTAKLAVGDLMILAKRANGQFLNIFAKKDSSSEKQLRILFDLSSVSEKAQAKKIENANDVKVDFLHDFILNNLGLIEETTSEIEPDYLAKMIELYPKGLPSTKEFSKFARSLVKAETNDPDQLVMEWWNTETKLFKIYEKYQFDSHVDKNLNDIDSFIELSLSIQNTRKSRAGSALENHIEQILIDNNVQYSRTQVTENNSKPDFIFPNIAAYRDVQYPDQDLRMLAVKTTCKDRWRQILAEAARVKDKHLLTLEPGISKNQTDEMRSHNVTLVLPKPMHTSYSSDQQKELMSISQFVSGVKELTYGDVTLGA